MDNSMVRGMENLSYKRNLKSLGQSSKIKAERDLIADFKYIRKSEMLFKTKGE